MDYVLGPGAYQFRGACLVRLDENYRKCVVWIGTGFVGKDDEIDPWGTGFLVLMTDPKVVYLVTAAHVVSNKADAPFEVRFNKNGGGAQNHTVEYPDWVFHETDNTVDVAVHEIEIPTWADAAVIPRHPNLLQDDKILSKDIGAGNRTYTVGIWKFLTGEKRNQPFVYTGHIGLVPEGQRIPVPRWLPKHDVMDIHGRPLVEAYLVEGEPLDGASGSPVFVRRSIPTGVVPRGEKKAIEATIEGSVWTLGLQSDAFIGEPGKDYQIPQSGKVIVPRGTNVVVPSKKITEVLDHSKLRASRAAKAAKIASENLPVKTSLEPQGNPRHKEDFMALLNAAAKTKKPDR